MATRAQFCNRYADCRFSDATLAILRGPERPENESAGRFFNRIYLYPNYKLHHGAGDAGKTVLHYAVLYHSK